MTHAVASSAVARSTSHDRARTRIQAPPAVRRDPYKWSSRVMGVLFVATAPAILGAVALLEPPLPQDPWEGAAAALGVESYHLELGSSVYQSACATCHGREGQGVPRLGKPLRNSEYVQTHSNGELHELIVAGRMPTDPANTTGSPMPARGGNPLLGDQTLMSVVYYLRTMQDPSQPTASLEKWIVEKPSESPTAAEFDLASLPGHDIYVASCSSCHGTAGEGLEGLGKPLADSEFVQSQSDEALLKFIKTGRPIWDAANTTGIDMPPKGGNPALGDEDLRTIIGYIRGLQEAGAHAAAASSDAESDGASAQAAAEFASLPGHDIYVASCSSCHGPAGEGIEGLGKPLAGSDFVVAQSDKDLKNFIKTGRPIWDPANTTGLDMPAKGGNPALSDDDLTRIISFVRALNADHAQ